MREAGLPIVAMCAADPGRRHSQCGRSGPRGLPQGGGISGASRTSQVRLHLGHARARSSKPSALGASWRGSRRPGSSQSDFVRWEGPFVFSTGVAAAEAFLRHEGASDRDLRRLRRERDRFHQDACARERVRVPQDVSVIGFDGIEFADYSEPTLTTFRQPLHELGRVGADVLMKLIRGEHEIRGLEHPIAVDPSRARHDRSGSAQGLQIAAPLDILKSQKCSAMSAM